MLKLFFTRLYYSFRPVTHTSDTEQISLEEPLIRTTATPHGSLSQSDQAKALYQDFINSATFNRSFRLQALVAFKRSKKKSFAALGLNNREIAQINLVLKGTR